MIAWSVLYLYALHFVISSHPSFLEAVEFTTTQDESIEMEHPSLLFFKPVYISKLGCPEVEVDTGVFILIFRSESSSSTNTHPFRSREAVATTHSAPFSVIPTPRIVHRPSLYEDSFTYVRLQPNIKGSLLFLGERVCQIDISSWTMPDIENHVDKCLDRSMETPQQAQITVPQPREETNERSGEWTAVEPRRSQRAAKATGQRPRAHGGRAAEPSKAPAPAPAP